MNVKFVPNPLDKYTFIHFLILQRKVRTQENLLQKKKDIQINNLQ